MKGLFIAFICLYTPTRVIDLSTAFDNQNGVTFTINIDDVHPGTSSMFTYEFKNTLEFEVDLYFVGVQFESNNELAKNTTLKMGEGFKELIEFGKETDLFVATIHVNESFTLDFEYSINNRAGNEIQGLAESIQLEFRILNDDIELPSTGEQTNETQNVLPPQIVLPTTGHIQKNRWSLIIIGVSLLILSKGGKDGDEDDT